MQCVPCPRMTHGPAEQKRQHLLRDVRTRPAAKLSPPNRCFSAVAPQFFFCQCRRLCRPSLAALSARLPRASSPPRTRGWWGCWGSTESCHALYSAGMRCMTTFFFPSFVSFFACQDLEIQTCSSAGAGLGSREKGCVWDWACVAGMGRQLAQSPDATAAAASCNC